MAYSTIDKPSSYFNTKLYTGNNNVTQTISGVGFQPDFTWIRCRNSAEYNHLADAVRGANKFLHSNLTDAERTGSYNDGSNTMAFTSDGFSLTNPTATDDELNFGSRLYCSWNWKANGAGSSNTSGTITSTASANTTSGFSIVSYTGNGTSGATVGHGLGVAPKMLIAKNRQTASNWGVWHTGIPMNEHLILNGTQASSVYTGFFNNTSPTSTLVTLGNDTVTNENTKSIILYCFAEVKGFSKFGSYTGNGNADGTFVYTGFKPSYIMIKYSSGASEGWTIIDNKRNTYNPESLYLYANTSGTEGTETGGVDFLSNGFKIRNSYGYTNNSGGTYIYSCFAENPFVSSKGLPTTAR